MIHYKKNYKIYNAITPIVTPSECYPSSQISCTSSFGSHPSQKDFSPTISLKRSFAGYPSQKVLHWEWIFWLDHLLVLHYLKLPEITLIPFEFLCYVIHWNSLIHFSLFILQFLSKKLKIKPRHNFLNFDSCYVSFPHRLVCLPSSLPQCTHPELIKENPILHQSSFFFFILF